MNVFWRMVWIVVFGLAWGQQDKGFENLQVLPKDISRQALRQQMIGFSQALGVRCWHCHVGEPGQPLSTYDFAADKKEAKATARVMLRMVEAVNNRHLADYDLEVSCVTCHRGVKQPQLADGLMDDVYELSGLAGVRDAYRDLRKKHYGRGVYDLSESMLNRLAFRLEERGALDDAAGLHRFNIELHPDYAHGHFKLGGFDLMAGQEASARERFRFAMEKQPRFAPTWMNNYAYQMKRAGKLDVGLAALLMLIELKPDHANGYDSAGEFYLAKGDRENARKYYELALAKDPTLESAAQALKKLEAE